MKYVIVLAISALFISLGLSAAAVPAQPQSASPYGQPQGWHGVLSADDQSQFDKEYLKWVDATRKNDQDDIASSARHMQEIMTRYNIPLNVPFDQIASTSAPGAYPAYGQWQGRLSPDDQREFNKHYAKWVEARGRNDRDDISNNARKMQEIMARYNIPTDVPFDQIATNGNAGRYQAGAYPGVQAAYPGWQGRLSPDDQKQFDKYYAKWVDATRKNDQDDILSNARKMQDIMTRYNIPLNVPFAQVASGGLAGPPNVPYGYPYGQPQRLSADDQHNFDKYYKKWLDARRKNDLGDVDSNARKMQDIMARYNIPANVSFDQIASPGAANR